MQNLTGKLTNTNSAISLCYSTQKL